MGKLFFLSRGAWTEKEREREREREREHGRSFAFPSAEPKRERHANKKSLGVLISRVAR
jgi:hypothetical protein